MWEFLDAVLVEYLFVVPGGKICTIIILVESQLTRWEFRQFYSRRVTDLAKTAQVQPKCPREPIESYELFFLVKLRDALQYKRNYEGSFCNESLTWQNHFDRSFHWEK
jgi:hypothetical protein